jgi:lipopolysaccharide transport system permease protein
VQSASLQPQSKPHFTIRPSRGWAHLNLPDLWNFRDLMWALAGRDVKLRYKQTALGIIWVVLQPLLGAGIFAFVFGVVAKMPSDGQPYFLLSYAGLLGWNLFNNVLTRASSSLVSNAPMVAKVFFPRMVLPLSTVPSALLDFAVAAAMMAIVMAGFRVAPGARLFLMPLFGLLLIGIAVGLSFLTSALMVSYRDVQHILPVFVQTLLYASPVAYSVSRVPEKLRTVYLLNPLASVLDAFRWSLLGGTTPNWGWLGYSATVTASLLFIGAVSFKRMERKFADVI